MKKLLTAEQTRQADAFTIATEPVSSIDLMERASVAFVKVFKSYYPNTEKSISIYCGTGNNGGDGLAIARLLSEEGYSSLNVKILRFSSVSSPDFDRNYARLGEVGTVPLTELTEHDILPVENAEIIIDAMLGSGLNKPLAGAWKELVIWLRSLKRIVVSVDIPTGLKAEGALSEKDIAITADLVITFQRPKINFLLPDSASYIMHFEVVDIGLDEGFIQAVESPYSLLTAEYIGEILKRRSPFSHKGTYGHALLIAGAPETMGAALLCAEACLHTGAGLTTACIPSSGLTALNARIPEAMAVLREQGALPGNFHWDKYTSAAIGPGLGNTSVAKSILESALTSFGKPVVLDADALNIISDHYELVGLLPEGTILTPHMKEFDRLFGEHATWWDRIEAGIERASTLGCVIVLKNRYTMIFTPQGECLFNPTGTPAMATGGMGDVLTGMIASFLAQGYSPEEAAILAVYLHGAAAEEIKGYVIPASLLARNLSVTIDKFTRKIKTDL